MSSYLPTFSAFIFFVLPRRLRAAFLPSHICPFLYLLVTLISSHCFFALLLRGCHLHLALALPFSDQITLLLRWRLSLRMKQHRLRDKFSST
jgi:hypothetical protein